MTASSRPAITAQDWAPDVSGPVAGSTSLPPGRDVRHDLFPRVGTMIARFRPADHRRLRTTRLSEQTEEFVPRQSGLPKNGRQHAARHFTIVGDDDGARDTASLSSEFDMTSALSHDGEPRSP